MGLIEDRLECVRPLHFLFVFFHSIARKSSLNEIQIPSFFHVQEESCFSDQLFLFRPAAVGHKPEQGVSPGNPGSPGDLRSKTTVSALSKRQPGLSSFLPALVSCCCPRSAHPALHPRRSRLVLGEPDVRAPMKGEGQNSQEGTQGPPLTAGVVLRALACVPARCERPARPPRPLHGGWRGGRHGARAGSLWGFPCAGEPRPRRGAVLSPRCSRAALAGARGPASPWLQRSCSSLSTLCWLHLQKSQRMVALGVSFSLVCSCFLRVSTHGVK